MGNDETSLHTNSEKNYLHLPRKAEPWDPQIVASNRTPLREGLPYVAHPPEYSTKTAWVRKSNDAGGVKFTHVETIVLSVSSCYFSMQLLWASSPQTRAEENNLASMHLRKQIAANESTYRRVFVTWYSCTIGSKLHYYSMFRHDRKFFESFDMTHYQYGMNTCPLPTEMKWQTSCTSHGHCIVTSFGYHRIRLGAIQFSSGSLPLRAYFRMS
jgi:hypothetical protein